jgi:death-on-curing protein
VSAAYLSLEQVLAIHHAVMRDHQQQAVLLAPGKLEGAIFRPRTEAFGTELFPSLAEKAAALLQAIVTAHAFMDGNKRAGLGAMLMFLRMNGVRTRPDLDALYDLAMAVTTGEVREVGEIAERLRGLFGGLG